MRCPARAVEKLASGSVLRGLGIMWRGVESSGSTVWRSLVSALLPDSKSASARARMLLATAMPPLGNVLP